MLDTETKHLVSMANDIAANLAFQANANENTADHIRRFWAPRMRRVLQQHVAAGGEGLSSAALAALERLQD